MVDALVESGRRRKYSRRDIVFYEGDEGSTLFLVVSGRFAMQVATPEGDTATIALLSPGDVFGDIAVLSPTHERVATVIALEPSEALMIPRHQFDRARSKHPVLMEALNAVLAERLRLAIRKILELQFVPAPIRVCRTLVQLAKLYADDQDEVVIPLNQSDIANLAGTSRETVSEVLREEQASGSLKLGRGKVRVVDQRHLLARSHV